MMFGLFDFYFEISITRIYHCPECGESSRDDDGEFCSKCGKWFCLDDIYAEYEGGYFCDACRKESLS